MNPTEPLLEEDERDVGEEQDQSILEHTIPKTATHTNFIHTVTNNIKNNMATMKQKFNDFIETVTNLGKMAEAEEVAMSEAIEEPKVEEPAAEETVTVSKSEFDELKSMVTDTHQFLFEDEPVIEEEAVEVEASEAEVEAAPKVEEPVAEVKEEEAKAESTEAPAQEVDYKKEFEAMKAELEAMKAGQVAQQENEKGFYPNPESKPENAKPKFPKRESAFSSPQDNVFKALGIQ